MVTMMTEQVLGKGVVKRHRGVALVLALLLLLVLTIVGIATMSGVGMQERMTANAVAQARAFEAASAGVSNALAFRDAAFNAPDNNLECGLTGEGNWFWPPQEFEEVALAGEWDDDVRLSQRLYCLTYENPETGFQGRELFVLSRGEVLSGNNVIAKRDIEVRVDRVGQPPGSVCDGAPWCFPLKEDVDIKEECLPESSSDFCACNFGRGTGNDPSTNPFDAATSNFEVVGQTYPDLGVGPAVALPYGAKLALQCAITRGETAESCEAGNLNTGGCQRLANYKGGFAVETEFESPWSDAAETLAFAQHLLKNADFLVADGCSESKCGDYDTWDVNIGGGNRVDRAGFRESGNFEFPENSISYIAGDASFGGTITGSGVLVVEGHMDWSGTNQFDGLIVVLGGEAAIGGGGSGGDHGGSLVVVDLGNDANLGNYKPSDLVSVGGEGDRDWGEIDFSEPDREPEFGERFSIEIGGGGGAEFVFNCKKLWEAYSTIYGNEYTRENPFEEAHWSPNCDPDATEPPAGTKTAIVSWREHIGWRSDLTFPGAEN